MRDLNKIKELERYATEQENNWKPEIRVRTKDILDIAEAFRLLEQKLESAEKYVAKLEAIQKANLQIKLNLNEMRKAAEAELARRDKEAGEPVAWVTMQKEFCDDERTAITNKAEADKYSSQCYALTPLFTAAQPAALPPVYQFDCGEGWQDVDQTDYERYINARGVSTRKVYTAAQPSALPPEVTRDDEADLILSGWDDDFMAGANWMRYQAKALSVKPLLVTLPVPFDLQGDMDGNCNLNEAKMIRDTGGIYLSKWEVIAALKAQGIEVDN